MASDIRSKKLAVLIDADNASATIAPGVFEEISKIGDASVRRIYGDFSGTSLKGWAGILLEHAITPHQQFAQAKGKNSSDIALVIDAMDLLHSGRFDGFCIISSDSDFARLAARIREQGIEVYGFGQRKTPNSFRKACHRFIYTENLTPVETTKAGAEPKKKSLKQPNQATRIIKRALKQIEAEEEWVPLGAVKNQILQLETDFDHRTYGHAKFSDLVLKTGAFEIDHNAGGSMVVRDKINPKGKRKTQPKK